MSVTPPTPPTQSTNTPLARRRGGVGGFFRGLLIILLGAALGIAGVGALAFYVFGYRPETPLQAGQVAQVQSDLATLRQQNSTLQTQVAGLSQRSTGSDEQIQDIDQQVRDLRSEMQALDTLGGQMQEYAHLAATVQLEARDSRTAVAISVSIQATRFAQLDDLQRRTERLGRFLDRLSDISGDAAADVNSQSGTPRTTEPLTATVIVENATTTTPPTLTVVREMTPTVTTSSTTIAATATIASTTVAATATPGASRTNAPATPSGTPTVPSRTATP